MVEDRPTVLHNISFPGFGFTIIIRLCCNGKLTLCLNDDKDDNPVSPHHSALSDKVLHCHSVLCLSSTAMSSLLGYGTSVGFTLDRSAHGLDPPSKTLNTGNPAQG